MYQFLMQGHPVTILITIFISALAVESLVSLIKDSDISHWLIHPMIISRYEKNDSWYNLVLYKWVTCGHCMSFIYSFPFAIFISVSLTGPYAFLLIWLVLQRLSNWLNDAYKLLSHGRATAVEFLTPLIEVSTMSSGNYFEDIAAREFSRGSLQTVNIRTLGDIQRIIKSTSHSNNNSKNATVVIDGKPVSINTSTNHPSYMQIIKDMLVDEQNIQTPTEEVESIVINGERLVSLQVQASSSVEKIIETCTGGVRDGNRIKWELPDGSVYFYNPITEKLTKLD